MRRLHLFLLALPLVLSSCAMSEATEEGVIKPFKKGSILGVTLAGVALLTTNPIAFFAAGLTYAFVETSYDTQDALSEEKEERREERQDTNLASAAVAAAVASGDPEAIESALSGLAFAQASRAAQEKADEIAGDMNFRDKLLLLAGALYALRHIIGRRRMNRRFAAVAGGSQGPGDTVPPQKPP